MLAPDKDMLGHAMIARRFYPPVPGSTQEQVDEAFAVALLAGNEAERVLIGKAGHPHADKADVAAVIGSDCDREAELRARANALVREHRATAR